MAKGKITHTEILVRAIQSYQDEINEWARKAEGNPGAEEVLARHREMMQEKIDAIKVLYEIETGVEYV